jgi:YD repeat-containing protein
VDTGGQNRAETFGYDAASGDLLTDTLVGYSNGSPFTHTATTTYNSHGLVLTQDGPRTDVSDVTTYTYYADGDADPAKRGRLHTSTNALSHVTTLNGYTISGKATVTIDPNGVERDDCYDDLDRLCGVTVKGPTPSDDLVRTYVLNADGIPDSVTLPNGNTITYTRDALHRLAEITDQPGNKTVYSYDTESRRTREEFRDPSATVTKFTNFKYDNYNRLQYVYYNATVPPGAGSIYWEYAYDNAGNRKSVKDPLGHFTCFEFDALNRRTKTHQYLGTPPAACLGTCTLPSCNDLLTQYGYDTQDHLITVTDPGGRYRAILPPLSDRGYLVKVSMSGYAPTYLDPGTEGVREKPEEERRILCRDLGTAVLQPASLQPHDGDPLVTDFYLAPLSCR